MQTFANEVSALARAAGFCSWKAGNMLHVGEPYKSRSLIFFKKDDGNSFSCFRPSGGGRATSQSSNLSHRTCIAYVKEAIKEEVAAMKVARAAAI